MLDDIVHLHVKRIVSQGVISSVIPVITTGVAGGRGGCALRMRDGSDQRGHQLAGHPNASALELGLQGSNRNSRPGKTFRLNQRLHGKSEI